MTITKKEKWQIYCYLLELAAKTADLAAQCSNRYIAEAHQQRADQIRKYATEFSQR